MLLVRPALLAQLALLVTSCGRLGFDSSPGDARTDDAARDAAVEGSLDSDIGDPSLELLINFEQSLDDMAKARPVSCVGGCPEIAPGGVGSAGTFAGTECLIVASAAELETQTFTVALWFQATDMIAETILSKPYQGTTTFENSFEFHKVPDGNVLFTTPGVTSTGAGQFTDVQWHHVAATYANSQVRTYFDGAAIGSATATMLYAGDALLIGCDIDFNVVLNQFVGQIDDVRYYSRVLTPAEIAALAQ